MATVTAFIRTSAKKVRDVNVRFRLRDGRQIQLLYSSDITVNPEHWNPKKEEIKAKVVMDPVLKAEFNRNVARIKEIIIEVYNKAEDKAALTSEWLALQVERTLHPAVHDEKEENNFFEDFDQFLEVKKLSEVRTRNFRVIYRALQRFELYRRFNRYSKFALSFKSVTPDILREFEEFLRMEHTYQIENFLPLGSGTRENRKQSI